ncbi:MAG: molecular chaperone DnaJ [Candidatus Schekmanbacteria bacterium]|nr:molecular chaperone DnaJ [Candidatus Schekmanbacteria bacterium]
MGRDLYKTLGVSRTATLKEIRQAYRKLARKYHPDVNPGDKNAEGRFKEIAEAYGILSDADKRKEYDRFGEAAFGAGASSPRGSARRPQGFDFEGFDFSKFGGGAGNPGPGRGFADILGDLFGGWSRKDSPPGAERSPQKGKDIQYSMDIGFEDAIRGVSATISFQRSEVCAQCKGVGTQPGGGKIACPQCGGTGRQSATRGPLSYEQPCSRCAGSGTITAKICGECGGRGSQAGTERLTVKIPPGVDTGSKIRLSGKGEPGINGGPAGDLFIVTRVQPHPQFERKGDNLYVEVPVTYVEAALGARLDVPTIDGESTMTLPPGAQSGQLFRLRERGVPHLKGGGRGDQYIKIRVTVPKNLDKRSRDILTEFARLNPENPRT